MKVPSTVSGLRNSARPLLGLGIIPLILRFLGRPLRRVLLDGALGLSTGRAGRDPVALGHIREATWRPPAATDRRPRFSDVKCRPLLVESCLLVASPDPTARRKATDWAVALKITPRGSRLPLPVSPSPCFSVAADRLAGQALASSTAATGEIQRLHERNARRRWRLFSSLDWWAAC